MIKRNLWKGSVVYVGVESKDKALEEAVLRKFYNESGTQILDLPDYVFVEWRDGYWVAVNYSSEKYELKLTTKQQIVLGERTLAPGGVTVWKWSKPNFKTSQTFERFFINNQRIGFSIWMSGRSKLSND